MRIVIDGAGEVGSHLAKLLLREGSEVTVIDFDDDRLAAISGSLDVEAIQGEPASVETLRNARIDKADLFISVVPYVAPEVNVLAAEIAKKLGAKKCLARIKDVEFLRSENRALLGELGVDMAFCPEKIAADEIVDIIRHSASTDTMDFAEGKLQVAAFRLGEDSPALDTTLVDFVRGIPAQTASLFRVIAIARDGDTNIPRFDSKFRYGDLVYIICKKEAVDSITALLGVHGTDISSVMILGGGTIGAMAAAKLSSRLDSVKVIEKERERCITLSETLPDEVQIISGDGRNPDFLAEESINDYDAFVALTGNDEANILSCVAAKKLGVQKTIAEVENIEYVKLAEEMGVDNVINKKLITAGRIFKFTLSDKTRFVRYMSGTDAEVMEYTVSEGSSITKGALKDIKFPEGAVIGGVMRDGEAFIAVGDTQIRPGDRVAVFALPSNAGKVDKFFK
ncbi:MAG: Trk system potassium transporter TrkA [Bacteroidales bacterium]|nr:Trk system potassium transporter TrkA [Candidatus Cryptobacteroides aphodequi]